RSASPIRSVTIVLILAEQARLPEYRPNRLREPGGRHHSGPLCWSVIMSRISVYSLSRLQPELEPALRKTLEAVAGVIERQEVDGVAVQERAATHVHIRVGPLLVFFRGAFGLERSAFVQFGHFVLDEAGRTRHDIDGEWSVGFGSIFPHEPAQKR